MDKPARQAGVGRRRKMDVSPPSEMEIVDTFTHLIFGGYEPLSDRESAIVEMLFSVDDSAAGCTRESVGDYLRELGVEEMIRLVTRVRSRFPASARQRVRTRSPSDRGQPARP